MHAGFVTYVAQISQSLRQSNMQRGERTSSRNSIMLDVLNMAKLRELITSMMSVPVSSCVELFELMILSHIAQRV